MKAPFASLLKATATLLFVATMPFQSKGAAVESEKKERATKMNEVVVTGKKDTGFDQATTATKTSTPIQDIPASIQIIPQEVFEKQGAVALDQTIRNVSGVTQSSSSNYGFFNNYLVRGLSLTFLRDGIPDGSTVNGYARSLTNVERIEVLKGPGSALYGTSQPGGSVNLVTKKPLSAPYYSIYQAFKSFDTYQTAIDATGPLSGDELLYRFNGGYYTTQGFRDLGSSITEALPVLTWNQSESHTVIFDFDYRKIDSVADTLGTPFRGRTLLDVSRDKKYYTPFGNTEQQILRGSIRDEFRFSDDLLLRNNLAILNRNLFLLRNAGGAIAANAITMTGRNLRRQTDNGTDLIYQLEPVAKLETGEILHTVLGGFEYQHRQVDSVRDTAALPNITNVFDPVVPENSTTPLTFTKNFDRELTADYYGLYGQDQIDFNDQWKARFGGRVDRFETDSVLNFGGTSARRFDTELSGQAGLVYQPTKATSFYAGYSKSSFAIFSSESTTIGAPENGTQYEVGNKTALLDGRINLNTALFRVIRENFLVTIGTEQVPVGEQQTQGIEFDLSGEPIKGWNLFGNYSIVEATLVSLPSDPASEGNKPTGVPTQSASAWTTYELQGGPLKGFGLGGGMTFKDGAFLDQRNTQVIPPYTVGDLVFFYKHDPFEIQLNVYNVADTTYYRNGVNSGALPGDPLSFQGSVRVRF